MKKPFKEIMFEILGHLKDKNIDLDCFIIIGQTPEGMPMISGSFDVGDVFSMIGQLKIAERELLKKWDTSTSQFNVGSFNREGE